MSLSFDELRRRDFARLDAGGHVYLDYTGSALYAESQLRAHTEELGALVLGNPHSRNPASRAATQRVDEVRQRVLRFFDADPAEYEVIFTPNATGALKLVAEAYPFDAASRLVLTADNHNSVHGMREYATARGADVRYVPLDEELRIHDLPRRIGRAPEGGGSLLVFPAQSNFSGVKHPLEWIGQAQEQGYDVFLDAAAFAPTNRLSLREHRPDYVCVAFYKMFGFPTGVGALLARCPALRKLRRPWFSGGTVRFVSAQVGVELLYPTGRGFEDGTVNFLSILALPTGLDLLDRLEMERVNEHVMELADAALQGMRALRHANGRSVVQLYGPAGTEGRGATLAFNLTDPQGEIWDFRVVEERAGEEGLSLRTGYFCNPGAAEFALAHPEPEVRRCVSTFSAETFDIRAFAECLDQRAVGAVRVSLGVPSNRADIDRFLSFLAGFRDQLAMPMEAYAAARAE